MTPQQIKKARIKAGLSRRDLAEVCGVSPRTVEAWEQGLRKPSGPALIILRWGLEDKN